MKLLVALACALAALFVSFAARAGDCNGPEACCNADPAKVTAPLPEHVRVGMRITHIRAVSERDGSWNGEVDLVYRWPAGGLRPDVTVRNAAADLTTSVDETTQDGDTCYRETRMSADFANWYRLRRFPFDEQGLRLLLEERSLTDEQAVWEPALWPNVIAIDAYRELTGWRVLGYPSFEVKRSTFSAVPGQKGPRLLIAQLDVRRISQFYLTRYFLPLFLIVALAYGMFWIKPEDLSSSASVGITCMLAIIAFQLTQADTLPHVAYLTIADRVYTVCYVATAFALGAVLWESHAAHSGKLEAASRFDRRMRVGFPVVFVALVAGMVWLGWASHAEDPDADIPAVLAPLAPPPGEAPR
jgi:hypothetical protein